MLPSLCSAEYRCKLCLYSVLADSGFKAATFAARRAHIHVHIVFGT